MKTTLTVEQVSGKQGQVRVTEYINKKCETVREGYFNGKVYADERIFVGGKEIYLDLAHSFESLDEEKASISQIKNFREVAPFSDLTDDQLWEMSSKEISSMIESATL